MTAEDVLKASLRHPVSYTHLTSEQTPSSVALGVLMNKDNTVRQAGGFMIQLMPGASDEIIDKLETRLGEITSCLLYTSRSITISITYWRGILLPTSPASLFLETSIQYSKWCLLRPL